ncbi:MAG: phage tail assembly protein [Pseudorhizobium pelagicum]|uniref:phage tail assembly protein n=1 Tax=Pseudorhizobium pelagicum TaxID=1509405 RepID=UPI00346057D8
MTEIESITVPLLKPVQHGDKTIKELTFREAEVGDLIDAGNARNEIERMVMVMAAVTGVPLEVFRKMKARELSHIIKTAGNPLGNDIPQPTGSD